MAGFGIVVAVAAAKERNVKLLTGLGAMHVVGPHLGDVGGSTRAVVANGLQFVFDAVNGGEAGHRFGVRLLSGSVEGTLVGLLPGTANEESVRGKWKRFEDKFSIGSGRMYRELRVLFWKHLPSWIDEGRMRPLGYEVVEGLDAGMVNEVLDGCY